MSAPSPGFRAAFDAGAAWNAATTSWATHDEAVQQAWEAASGDDLGRELAVLVEKWRLKADNLDALASTPCARTGRAHDRPGPRAQAYARRRCADELVEALAIARQWRAGETTPNCLACRDTGDVCEAHPDRVWEGWLPTGDTPCCGGAGAPCERCDASPYASTTPNQEDSSRDPGSACPTCAARPDNLDDDQQQWRHHHCANDCPGHWVHSDDECVESCEGGEAS